MGDQSRSRALLGPPRGSSQAAEYTVTALRSGPMTQEHRPASSALHVCLGLPSPLSVHLENESESSLCFLDAVLLRAQAAWAQLDAFFVPAPNKHA